MANEQNLTHKLTVSEQREGGRKSGEVRRQKRTLREIMEAYGAAQNQLEPNLTNDEKLVIEQYRQAGKGNTQAAAFIRDTKGEKPHEVLETPDIEIKPLVDLTNRKKNGSDS